MTNQFLKLKRIKKITPKRCMTSGVRFLDRFSENRISFILIQHFICCFIFQDAKETLLDPAKRSNYDKWRNSGIKISYKNWLGMKEHVHQVKKEPSLSLRLICSAAISLIMLYIINKNQKPKQTK